MAFVPCTGGPHARNFRLPRYRRGPRPVALLPPLVHPSHPSGHETRPAAALKSSLATGKTVSAAAAVLSFGRYHRPAPRATASACVRACVPACSVPLPARSIPSSPCAPRSAADLAHFACCILFEFFLFYFTFTPCADRTYRLPHTSITSSCITPVNATAAVAISINVLRYVDTPIAVIG